MENKKLIVSLMTIVSLLFVVALVSATDSDDATITEVEINGVPITAVDNPILLKNLYSKRETTREKSVS